MLKTAVKNDFPVGPDSSYFKTVKVAGQTIEVLLRPLVKWMVVTLSAIEPNSHECLAYRTCPLFRRAKCTKEIDRSVLRRIPARGEQFSNPLVVGTIMFDLLTQPAVKLIRTAFTQLLAID